MQAGVELTAARDAEEARRTVREHPEVNSPDRADIGTRPNPKVPFEWLAVVEQVRFLPHEKLHSPRSMPSLALVVGNEHAGHLAPRAKPTAYAGPGENKDYPQTRATESSP